MAFYLLPIPLNPVILVLLCIIIFLIYQHLKRIYSVFETLNIPGPKPVWMFGNIQDFRDKDPLGVFKEWRKTYGDVYGFYEGFRPSIVINDPEVAKLVLVRHFDKFNVRPIYSPFNYHPDELSLLNTFGETWKRQRGVVASAFNTASAQHMLNQIQETGSKLLSKIDERITENPNGFDISKLLDRYTSDAFALSSFDYDVGSLDDQNALLYQYMKVCNESAAADNPVAGLARVYESLTPFLQLFDRKHKEIHEQYLHEMRNVLKKQMAKLENSDEEPSPKTLLTQMIMDRIPVLDENGKISKRRLTTEELIAHVNSLVGGGLGTTDSALSFVIHQLAMNQDIQQKAYENVVEHFGAEGEIDLTALKDEDYLDKIIYETLRTLPCAPGIARSCTEDCMINGIQFRKGMLIRIMTCTLYADGNIFPNPEKFDPERFSTTQKEARNQYSFLPYGGGPRICPGVKLANMLMKVCLIRLIQKYHIEPCSKTVDPLPTALRPMLVPKNGVFVQMCARH